MSKLSLSIVAIFLAFTSSASELKDLESSMRDESSGKLVVPTQIEEHSCTIMVFKSLLEGDFPQKYLLEDLIFTGRGTGFSKTKVEQQLTSKFESSPAFANWDEVGKRGERDGLGLSYRFFCSKQVKVLDSPQE